MDDSIDTSDAVPVSDGDEAIVDPTAAFAEATPESEEPPADDAEATPATPKPRSSKPRRARAGGGRSTKEAFWVRVALDDGTTQFFPATEHIGRVMPFTNPKETCAMRVYPDVVCFSLLHLTKRASKDLRDKPISMPHAPLSRLARRASEVDAAAGTIVVEHRQDINGESVDRSITMSVSVDGAKVASLSSEDPAADEAFELGGRGERISLFLTSGTVGRRIALGYIGHLGRPGGPDTLARCAAKILNAVAALPEFTLLTGIEAADVPAMAGGLTAVRPTNTTAGADIAVRLFTDPNTETGEAPAAVGDGTVRCEIDLEHAAGPGRLLFHLVPDEAIADVFDAYKPVAERWMNTQLGELLGEELNMIAIDAMLGEVDDGTVVRINEKLAVISAVDFTPSKFRARS